MNLFAEMELINTNIKINTSVDATTAHTVLLLMIAMVAHTILYMIVVQLQWLICIIIKQILNNF